MQFRQIAKFVGGAQGSFDADVPLIFGPCSAIQRYPSVCWQFYPYQAGRVALNKSCPELRSRIRRDRRLHASHPIWRFIADSEKWDVLTSARLSVSISSAQVGQNFSLDRQGIRRRHRSG